METTNDPQPSAEPRLRSGMVSIFGEPNAGKSTLVNTLVGWKVSIISSKPQTTWYAVRGVLNRPEGQIVLVDTPGFVRAQPKRVPVSLRGAFKRSLQGVDAVVRLIDASRPPHPGEASSVDDLLRGSGVPRVAALNKIDAASRDNLEIARRLVADYPAIFEISALLGTGLNRLVEHLFGLLPEAKPLYPRDARTDLPLDVWIAEQIREKVFEVMEQELPYTATVRVEELAERPNGVLYVNARIRVAEARQRGLFIGAGGATIRRIGTAARREIERALDRKVFLDIKVKERRR